MPLKKWDEVIQSARYQSLSDDDKNRTRELYLQDEQSERTAVAEPDDAATRARRDIALGSAVPSVSDVFTPIQSQVLPQRERRPSLSTFAPPKAVDPAVPVAGTPPARQEPVQPRQERTVSSRIANLPENLLQAVSDIPEFLGAGAQRFAGGLSSFGQLTGKVSGVETIEEVGKRGAEFFERGAEAISPAVPAELREGSLFTDPSRILDPRFLAKGFFENLPQLAGTYVPAAIAFVYAGVPAAVATVLTMAFAQEAGQHYQETGSEIGAIGVGTVNAALEAYTPLKLLGDPGRKLLTRLFVNAVREGTTESIQETVSVIAEKLEGRPMPDDARDTIGRIMEAGLFGAMLGGSMGAVSRGENPQAAEERDRQAQITFRNALDQAVSEEIVDGTRERGDATLNQTTLQRARTILINAQETGVPPQRLDTETQFAAPGLQEIPGLNAPPPSLESLFSQDAEEAIDIARPEVPISAEAATVTSQPHTPLDILEDFENLEQGGFLEPVTEEEINNLLDQIEGQTAEERAATIQEENRKSAEKIFGPVAAPIGETVAGEAPDIEGGEVIPPDADEEIGLAGFRELELPSMREEGFEPGFRPIEETAPSITEREGIAPAEEPIDRDIQAELLRAGLGEERLRELAEERPREPEAPITRPGELGGLAALEDVEARRAREGVEETIEPEEAHRQFREELGREPETEHEKSLLDRGLLEGALDVGRLTDALREERGGEGPVDEGAVPPTEPVTPEEPATPEEQALEFMFRGIQKGFGNIPDTPLYDIVGPVGHPSVGSTGGRVPGPNDIVYGGPNATVELTPEKEEEFKGRIKDRIKRDKDRNTIAGILREQDVPDRATYRVGERIANLPGKYPDWETNPESEATLRREAIQTLLDDELVSEALVRDDVVPEKWGQAISDALDALRTEVAVKKRKIVPRRGPRGETVITTEPVPEEAAPAPTERIDELEAKERTPQGEVEFQTLEEEVRASNREDDFRKARAQTTGKNGKAFTADNQEVDFEYAIVDLSSLVASHSPQGIRNPEYPQGLQPRDRTRAASQLQVREIAQTLNPERMGGNPLLSEGAMVVGPDGIVESGNNRKNALEIVYEQLPEKAEEYRTWLENNAESKFGVSLENAADMPSPVLVRVRTSEIADRSTLGEAANIPTTQQLNVVERARLDAGKLATNLLVGFAPTDNGVEDTLANREFFQNFNQQVVPSAERNAFMDANGRISQEGLARVRNAVLFKAYGNEQVISRVAESLDNNSKNITNSLVKVAPRWVGMQESIQAGRLYSLDVSGDIVSALRVFSRLRDEGTSLENYFNQPALFGKELTAEAEEILRIFDKYNRSGKKIHEYLSRVIDAVEAAGNPNQENLFEGKVPNKADILISAERAMRLRHDDRTLGLFGEGPPTGPARGGGPTGEITSAARAQAEEAAEAPTSPEELRGELRPAADIAAEAAEITEEDFDRMFDTPVPAPPPPVTPGEKIRARRAEPGERRAPSEKTAADIIKATAKAGVTGIDEATKALHELFGGSALKTFPGGLDQNTYNKAKPHFQASLEAFKEAGKGLHDFVQHIKSQFGEAIRPYLRHFVMVDRGREITEGAAPTPAAPANPGVQVVEGVKDFLDKSSAPLTSGKLFEIANEVYGGTQAKGSYTPTQAYDAMEAAVNKVIQENNILSPDVSPTPVSSIELLDKLADRLPTQSKRSEERVEFQQFSTPPPLAYIVNWVANITPGDTVLEPSAGTGNIAVFAQNAGANVIVNELADHRAGLLEGLGFDTVMREDGEQIGNILASRGTRPDAVVMNPPFSRAGQRMAGKKLLNTGANHVEQGLKALKPGGRLVAVLGKGMVFNPVEGTKVRDATGKAFRKWWNDIQKKYNVRAVVPVSGLLYRKHGTTFDNVVAVIDNTGPTPSSENIVAPTTLTTSYSDLISMLGGIRDARGETARIETEPGRPETPEVPEEGPGVQPEVTGPEPAAVGVGGVGVRPGAIPRTIPQSRGETGIRPGPEEGGEVPLGQPREPRGRVPGAVGEGEGRPAGTRTGALGAGRQLEPGERPETLEPERPISVTGREEAKAPEGPADTAAIFEDYRPHKLTVDNAQPHPTKLVESTAMAGVESPDITYTPNLPQEIIDNGVVSGPQVENVTYAGQAHEETLPDGSRKGFLVGDGTGAGKGRQIAAIIVDNFNQGRKKAVWFSNNQGLLDDAKRDVEALGMDPKTVVPQSKTQGAKKIEMEEGVLFSTYPTLRGKTKDTPPRTRIDQLVEWLGKDFDGAVVFDEVHNLGNSMDIRGERGVQKATQAGLAGVELQTRLPKARIVYASATTATEVRHLAFADRLGIWGEGTPFPNKESFVNQISSGGVAAMEVVARDLKALGVYQARSLSYEDVEYDRLTHNLTEEQREIYDTMAEGWQIVLQNIEAALEITQGDQNSNQRSSRMSQFWGAHQRFFNQVVTSLQMPSVIEDIKKKIEDGESAVLQLVNTNEAAQNRALARQQEGDELEDLDLTPREHLMNFVQNSFPVQQFQEQMDEQGNATFEPVVDSQGNPVENPEAVARRDELLIQLGGLKVPESPLEIVLNTFGRDNVAEVTGRSKRITLNPEGRAEEEKWSKTKGKKDAQLFQAGRKRILVFSDAGGTGVSYHADLTAENQQRRNHYLVQAGWQANKAMQGFGRTHRSNQANAPRYFLVQTDINGQKRFISSIARRLDQLGALTKGQRQTGGGGIFQMRDNLESEYAVSALRKLIEDIVSGNVEGIAVQDFQDQTGLRIVDNNGQLLENMPRITQFLNRLLSMKLDAQNKVFDEFGKRMDHFIDLADQAGTLNVGMESVRALGVEVKSDQAVFTHEATGAKTRFVELEATFPNKAMEWAETGGRTVYRNRSTGVVWGGSAIKDVTTERGGIVETRSLITPGRRFQRVEETELNNPEKWEKLGRGNKAKEAWEEAAGNVPTTRKSSMNLITGALLPIWDRIPGDPKIKRIVTDTGQSMMGRVIPEKDVEGVLQNLGSTREGVAREEITIADAGSALQQGAAIRLANGWRIAPRRVSGEERFELLGAGSNNFKILREQGAFIEIIAHRSRVFIPTGPAGHDVFSRIAASNPVVEIAYPTGEIQRGKARERLTETLRNQRGAIDFQSTSGRRIFADLVEVGREIIANGDRALRPFIAKLKAAVGDSWDKVKAVAARVWARAREPLRGERGAVRLPSRREQQRGTVRPGRGGERVAAPEPLSEEEARHAHETLLGVDVPENVYASRLSDLADEEGGRRGLEGDELAEFRADFLTNPPNWAKNRAKFTRPASINILHQAIPESLKQFETEVAKLAPRKRQSWDETGRLADEIMESYEETARVALKSKSGDALNAAEMEVMRRLNVNAVGRLQEMAEEGLSPEEFERQYKIYVDDIFTATSDASSEAGRALNIHKKDVSMGRMANAFANLERSLNERELEELKMLNFEDPLEVQRFLDRLGDPTLSDYFYEYWYNSILSGLPTHVVNVGSNTLWAAYQVEHRTLEAGVDKVISKLRGRPQEVFMSEVLPMLAGYRKGFKRGAGKALEVIKTGKLQDMETKWAQEMGHGIIGAFDRSPSELLRKAAPVLTAPTRALRAMDVWANAAGYDAQIAALAKREGRKQGLRGNDLREFESQFEGAPPEWAMENAGEFARHSTFMNDPGAIANWIVQGRDIGIDVKTKIGGVKVGKIKPLVFVVPFVRTITNLLKRGIELTPLVGIALARGKTPANVIAKQIEGAVIGMFILAAIDDDRVTGEVPRSKSAREAFFRQGKLPWAIKFGNTWVQYRRVEPFNTVIASVALAHDKIINAKDEETGVQIFGNMADGLVKNLIDSSYLQGVTQVLDRHGRRAGMLQRQAASLVPFSSFFRSINRALEVATEDDNTAKVRETKSLMGAFSQVIPGLSGKMPARMNVWGEEIVLPGGILRQWLPIKWAEESPDPVEEMLEKVEMYPGLPRRTVAINGVKTTLDDDIYRNYALSYGSKAKSLLSRRRGVISRIRDDAVRRKLINRMLTKIRAVELKRAKAKQMRSTTTRKKVAGG